MPSKRPSAELAELGDEWATLAWHWSRVVGSRRFVCSSSRDWIVDIEMADGSPPADDEHGDFVVVYHGTGEDQREVGRWPLEDVAAYELEDTNE